MKNVPRIYIDQKIKVGQQIPVPKETLHYLQKVMRTDRCLVFNDGVEYIANLIPDSLKLIPDSATDRPDPSNDITFCFAPIKKTDDMLNMVTQMGVAKLQPVITDRTVAHHVNWERMKKIIIEAAEQSNRNSIPELLPPVKFSDLMHNVQSAKCKLIFADERAAHGKNMDDDCNLNFERCALFVGPEGGFSDAEFATLDESGAVGISLGKTILRAEVAAVALVTKILSVT